MNRASVEENSHGLFYDENNYFIGHHKFRWDRKVSYVVYHTHFINIPKHKLTKEMHFLYCIAMNIDSATAASEVSIVEMQQYSKLSQYQ